MVHKDGRLIDAAIRDLPDFLTPGDTLVFNDTRVLPAALKGVRRARDEHSQDIEIDANLVEKISEDTWLVMARPGKRLRSGDVIVFADNFLARVRDKQADGKLVVTFNRAGQGLVDALDQHGAMPLPPYIARKRPADASDRATYQTSFAGDQAASVAAPTAGLHFTPRLLEDIASAGICSELVRLHVGLGTFAPLQQSQIDAGKLHEEWRQITETTAARLNAARKNGRKCVAVGTTALRTLESSTLENGNIQAASGPTDIFLRPGYRFRATDALLTNFHLPKSSLFMLVCALMGTGIMQAAYAHAVQGDYRFYSYGDACLLLP